VRIASRCSCHTLLRFPNVARLFVSFNLISTRCASLKHNPGDQRRGIRAAPNGPDSIYSPSSGQVLTSAARPHDCERRPNTVEFRRVLFTWCLSDDSNRLHQRSTFLPCRRLLGLLFAASTSIELNLNPLMTQGIWRRRREAFLDFTLASSVPAYGKNAEPVCVPRSIGDPI
jgi:hypothetical protein